MKHVLKGLWVKSMDDINNVTTLTEIATVLGKTKRAIEILANKSRWSYALESTSGKKRLYALTALPSDIHEKIIMSRLNATLRLDDTTKAVIAAKNTPPATVERSEKTALAKAILDDKQRERDGSRRLILQFVRGFKGGLRKAVAALNSGYEAGTLHPDLMHAIRHCNDKANHTRIGNLSVRSVTRWKSDAKNNGHCIPLKTRIETRWYEIWWLPILLACYRNPQKPHISEAYAEFKKDWQAQGLQKRLPSYTTARRSLNKVPEVILEMGRSTGSELAALRSFVRRDWSGMSNEVAKQMPTFQGTGMDEGTMRKNTQTIESAKRKGDVPKFVPTWQQFIDDCEARFHWYNTQHQHSSLGGKTPTEVYHAGFDENWACPLSEDEIINLYRPSDIRTPNRGEIRWLNNIYFHQSLAELPANTKVSMAYDVSDASKVWVSDLNGRFLCVAEFEGNKRAGFPVSLKDSLKEKRIDGMEKRGQEKIDRANAERGNVIDGEVLQRVPVIPSEPVEPLKRVVIEGEFQKQRPEEKRMGYLETMMHTQGGKAAGAD